MSIFLQLKKFKILNNVNFNKNFDLAILLVPHKEILKKLYLFKNSETILFDIFGFYKE